MIEYWHNPRCSKSRAGLALLEGRGVDLHVRRYLDNAPSLEELTAARAALGNPPAAEMMRTKEKLFKELGLSPADDDAKLMAAMAENPVLIERPLAIRGARAVIGRPPEKVLDLL